MIRQRLIASMSVLCGLSFGLLTACSDPCFLSPPDAPNCRAAQGGADATLTAIRGAQSVEATRSAVMLSGAATQSALGVQATAQALAGQATVQAKIIEATLTAADAEATQAAIAAAGNLARGQVAAVGAPVLELLGLGTLAALLIYVVWYSRRGLQSVSRALDLRASTLRHGPDGSELLIVRQLANGEEQVLNLSQLVGPYATTDGKDVREAIGTLSLPDQFKAYLWLEAHQNQKNVETSYATGRWPIEVAGPEPLAALPPVQANYPYVIEAVSGSQQPVMGWLDEAEQRLLAAPQEV